MLITENGSLTVLLTLKMFFVLCLRKSDFLKLSPISAILFRQCIVLKMALASLFGVSGHLFTVDKVSVNL